MTFPEEMISKTESDFRENCKDRRKSLVRGMAPPLLEGHFPNGKAWNEIYIDYCEGTIFSECGRKIITLEKCYKPCKKLKKNVTNDLTNQGIAIFDSIPSQLNEKNLRFMLSPVSANARQLRYSDSFNWLSKAGFALSLGICIFRMKEYIETS